MGLETPRAGSDASMDGFSALMPIGPPDELSQVGR